MEAHRGARSVTQQRLDPEPAPDPAPSGIPDTAAVPTAPPLPPGPPAERPLPPDSGAELWERRRRWREERERRSDLVSTSSGRGDRRSGSESVPSQPSEA